MIINPITVAEALPIVADELGINLESNREEALLHLNRIRNLWYSGFQKRRLFDDLVECVQVCELCERCIDCGCKMYRGFSLPQHMAGPVTAWASTEPVTMRSRWFDKYAGRHSGSVKAFILTPIPGVFVTEFDIHEGTRISITAASSCDDGKQIRVKGIGCDGKINTVTFRLVGDGATESVIEFSNIHSIILPKLCGEVTIRSVIDGRVLSVYSPGSPLVPQFRRFRIDSPCPDPCTVLVQANRRYRDLYHDDDIVEIGDRLVIEHGASYFRFGKNTTDTKELQRAQMDRMEMINLIQGMVEREDGGHIQDGQISLRGRRTKRANLPGYRN